MYKIYLSDSHSPYFNLALEEYLVHCHAPGDQTLFLWQNYNTVVIGRNQNPWKECNLEELNRQEGCLVRRLSGGGAVYHDSGNLNFTYISDFTERKVEENISLIIRALNINGVPAVFSGKNDILAQGCKVSGNAFFIDEDTLCHHGTLLVDADLAKLGSMLTVSRKKLQSKGIDSVKSRVSNLNALNPEITIERLKNDLIQVFLPQSEEYTVFQASEAEITDCLIDPSVIHTLKERFESWDWNFGSSPEFNLHVSERFDWGEVDLYLEVNDGIIANMEVNTDALDIDIPQKIKERLCHSKFDYDAIMSLLASDLNN